MGWKMTNKIIVIVLIISLVVVGCDSKNYNKSENDPLMDSDYEVIFPNNSFSISKTGICKVESGIAHFWDAATKYGTVLCSKPNCSHEKQKGGIGSTCDAFLGNRVDLLFVKNQSIYYISDMESGNNGLSSIFDRKLMKADINGKNRKTIFEFKDIQEVGGINCAYVFDEWFTFGYCVSDIRKETDDIVLGKSDKRRAGIYLVNLETEKALLINEMIEYGAYCWYPFIDGNKLYYLYSYRTDDVNPMDFDNQEEYYEKVTDSYRWDLYYYDLKTGNNMLVCRHDGKVTFVSKPSDGYYIFDTDTESIFYKDGKEVARYPINELADHDPPFICKYVYKDVLYMSDCEKIWSLNIKNGEKKYLGKGCLDEKNILNVETIIDGNIYYNIYDPVSSRSSLYMADFNDFIEGNLENSTLISF